MRQVDLLYRRTGPGQNRSLGQFDVFKMRIEGQKFRRWQSLQQTIGRTLNRFHSFSCRSEGGSCKGLASALWGVSDIAGRTISSSPDSARVVRLAVYTVEGRQAGRPTAQDGISALIRKVKSTGDGAQKCV